MRFIQLHKVSRENVVHMSTIMSPYADTDDVGENQPREPQEASAADLVMIQVDAIRCFYKRRADRGPGTRITFKDGGGFAVHESYDEVRAAVETH